MEQLGIQPSLLLAQIINFAIIVVVLSKLLYKPILGILEKRKKEIEEGLKISERMRQEEENLKGKREKMLEEARREGHKIIEEARRGAKDEEKEILAVARSEAEDIVAKGKKEVERLGGELTKKITRDAATLGVVMAKRLLIKTLNQKDQREILEKHIREIEKHVS